MTRLFCLIAALGLVGCGTVAQKPVASRAASYDGNAQDSGILQKTAAGFIVTAHFRDRYNALIAVYGHARLEDGSPVFSPPLAADFGITPVPTVIALADYGGQTVYLIDDQGMTAMVVMSGLKRRGFRP